MLTVRLGDVEPVDYWAGADPTLHGRVALPMHAAAGTASTAVITTRT